MSSWNTVHEDILLLVTNTPLPANISDLWMQGTTQWNQDLLSTTFTPQAVQTITNTPIVHSPNEDILRWKPSTNGQCTSKSAYKFLQIQQTHSLPSTGTRAISPQTDIILQKIWKAKIIPPLLKTFVWRLFRQALATAERVGRFATHIGKHCTVCGAIENDTYFSVQFASTGLGYQ
jgi:hypothetical protein